MTYTERTTYSEKLISTRPKWYTYLLVLSAISLIAANVAIIVVLGVNPFSKNYLKLFSFSLPIVILTVISVWYMRRVTVYEDRIEVRFPFHWRWNHEVLLKDVDALCMEEKETERRDGSVSVTKRLYLLTGKKLWLYVSSRDDHDFFDMCSILTERLSIPMYEHEICISAEDDKRILRGKSILLKDISRKDLQKLREQRQQRLQAGVTYIDIADPQSSPWDSYFFPIAVGVIIVSLFVITLLSAFANKKTTVELARIDANTKVPVAKHLIVNYIDAESNGIYISHDVHIPSNSNANCALKSWVFKVKGRDDVWITLGVLVDKSDDIPWQEQRDFCLRLLHEKHRYEQAENDNHKKIRINRISQTAKGIRKTKESKIVLLNCAETIKMGSVLYHEAIYLLTTIDDEKRDYNKAYSLLIKAAKEGNPESQYKLGSMCLDNNKNEAIKWYEAAARQNKKTRIKCEALNELSYIYAERKEYDKAIAAIDSAIIIMPNEANYYDSKGELLYHIGDKKEARRTWKKVISLDPNFEKTHKSKLKGLLEGK